MKPVTELERQFCKRILRTAVNRAVKSGDCMKNQSELWKIVVESSWKPKKVKK